MKMDKIYMFLLIFTIIQNVAPLVIELVVELTHIIVTIHH